jgi:hypothetical protein
MTKTSRPASYHRRAHASTALVRAETELKKRAVEQKRTDIAFERANKYLDLAQKVAKIRDPWVRAQMERVISSNLVALEKEPLALPPPNQNEGNGAR